MFRHRTYDNGGCPRDVLELPSQAFEHAFEVGEGDWAADVEQDGVLLPLHPLEVLQLAEHVGVADLAEFLNLDRDAAVEQDDERESDADDQAHVDVHDDDGNERSDPKDPVEFGTAGKLGEVVDLHEHALQGHNDDGGKNGLFRDNIIFIKQFINGSSILNLKLLEICGDI